MQLQQTVASQMINMNMVIVMCGISKVFVGELVEKGALTGSGRVYHCLSRVTHSIQVIALSPLFDYWNGKQKLA